MKNKSWLQSRQNLIIILLVASILFDMSTRLIATTNYLTPESIIQSAIKQQHRERQQLRIQPLQQQQARHRRHHQHPSPSLDRTHMVIQSSSSTPPPTNKDAAATVTTSGTEQMFISPPPLPLSPSAEPSLLFTTSSSTTFKPSLDAADSTKPEPITTGTGLKESRGPSPSPPPSISIFDVDKFIPSGYDKLMPPKENGNPTIVRFHVWVLGLDSIDEGSMTYVADIFMSQSWKDNRLVIPDDIIFNVNSSSDPRGPYRLLPLTLIDKIWRPDSFFKNAKEVTFQEMTIPNHYIWLYSDNTILYMVKLTLLLSCAMKFQTYPHDTQNCTLKIESLSYTTNDLVFDWEESDPLVVEDHIELPQHDLIHKDIDYCTTIYSSGTFACVQVVLTIKRRLGYYIFHTYIPTCLIVIMSWISFWIKPEAVPARVTLCVTSLLTLSTQHAQSQKSLPPVSYIKAIDIFMSTCTVFVFASLMEYALVNILMSDELLNGWIGIAPTAYQLAHPPPPHIRGKNSTTAAADTTNDHHQHSSAAQPPVASGGRSPPLIATTDWDHHYHYQNRAAPNHNHLQRYHSLTRLDTINTKDLFVKQLQQHECVQQQTDCQMHRAIYFGDLEQQLPPPSATTPALRHRYRSTATGNGDGLSVENGNHPSFRHKSVAFATSSPQQPPPPPLPEAAATSAAAAASDTLTADQSQYLLQSKHRRAYTVDNISRWIFPLSFIMLNLVYWTYYLDL